MPAPRSSAISSGKEAWRRISSKSVVPPMLERSALGERGSADALDAELRQSRKNVRIAKLHRSFPFPISSPTLNFPCGWPARWPAGWA